jgi:hypothetical protein
MPETNPFNFRDEAHKKAIGEYGKQLLDQVVYSNAFSHTLQSENISIYDSETAALVAMSIALGYSIAKLEE